MSTTFYGPWVVVLGLNQFDVDLPKRFVISGSENADGIYPVAFGNALVMLVEGAKWQLEIQHISPFDPVVPNGWEPAVVDESMRFVLGDGLIVELRSFARLPVPTPTVFDAQGLMEFTCTSMDPEINPIPTANPFSFTIGEGTTPTGNDYGARY